MPTYDYLCENGHRFEVFQSMKDEALTTCKECGAPVRRVIGPGAGFIFKGGGFYITDYRSKEYKEKAKSDSQAAGGSSSGGSESGSKSESKSDSSSTSKGESKGSGAAAPKTGDSGGGSKPSGGSGGSGGSSGS
jgi:putative FmdB family regulatory protein